MRVGNALRLVVLRLSRKKPAASLDVLNGAALSQFRAAGGDALLTDFDLSENSIVVDVGGYHRKWATDVFARYACRMLIVEPVPEYAAILRNKFKNNPRVRVFEIALGNSERSESLIFAGDASSVLAVSQGTPDTRMVRVVDASKWLDALEIEQIDVMALNCEGGEYEIIPHLHASGWIPRIKTILVQFHIVGEQPQARRRAIESQLSATHIRTMNFPFVWERWSLRETVECEGGHA